MGQKVLSFYTSTSKQVLDIHDEARRIVDQHKAHTPPKPTTPPLTAAPSGASEAQTEPTTHAAPAA